MIAMPSRRILRDNAFIVAAVALPVLVAGFFLAASAIPRWTVPLPGYDVVLKVQRSYDASRASLSLDFDVRDHHVVAILKPVAANGYVQRWALLVVDHATLRAREVPFSPPERLNDGEPERVIVVPALAALPVSTAVEAPDGYALRTRTSNGGPGLVGEVFGMRTYRQRTTLSGHGRTVTIALPAPYEEPYQYTAFLGWVTGDGRP